MIQMTFFFVFFCLFFCFFFGSGSDTLRTYWSYYRSARESKQAGKVVVSPRFWSVFVVLLVPDLCKSSIPSLDSVTNPVVRHRT